MKARIYIDTSVIGGCLDRAFAAYSRRLLDRFHAGEFIAVVSDLTRVELMEAPAAVRAVFEAIPEAHREDVDFTEEAAELANRYIAANVVGEANRADAQHIAMATVNRVDVLVSWNFRHIVNLRRIRAYNSVNMRNGYPILEIRTPAEVVGHEEDAEIV